MTSRRNEFGIGTTARIGEDGPIESAIDRVGGNSTDFLKNLSPSGFTDYDAEDSSHWSNHDRNRYETGD